MESRQDQPKHSSFTDHMQYSYMPWTGLQLQARRRQDKHVLRIPA